MTKRKVKESKLFSIMVTCGLCGDAHLLKPLECEFEPIMRFEDKEDAIYMGFTCPNKLKYTTVSIK